MHSWEYPEKELEKLKDPEIKIACLVNPSNPPSVALSTRERKKIIDIVKKENLNLMFITDDVYDTFVKGLPETFRVSLANLNDEAYTTISKALKEMAAEYLEDWGNRRRPGKILFVT
jgi:aspartate/methionine/tyrosine aminotransferase